MRRTLGPVYAGPSAPRTPHQRHTVRDGHRPSAALTADVAPSSTASQAHLVRAPYLSRWEHGKRSIRDVHELRPTAGLWGCPRTS
jgi:hypothetical protein